VATTEGRERERGVGGSRYTHILDLVLKEGGKTFYTFAWTLGHVSPFSTKEGIGKRDKGKKRLKGSGRGTDGPNMGR